MRLFGEVFKAEIPNLKTACYTCKAMDYTSAIQNFFGRRPGFGGGQG
jgi:hypothetical protein